MGKTALLITGCILMMSALAPVFSFAGESEPEQNVQLVEGTTVMDSRDAAEEAGKESAEDPASVLRPEGLSGNAEDPAQGGNESNSLIISEDSAPGSETSGAKAQEPEYISLDMNWEYAGNSVIHSGQAVLYHADSAVKARTGHDYTICVNAGHGTSGGTDAKTLSHPDGTGKVTGGTNGAGEVYSIAVSTGMTFQDGTTEASVNLLVALSLRDQLLADGYDVLMIRESDDVQLDNIARTVIANNCADAHVAIHFDSTDYDKGCYYCAVPKIGSYLAMEPVASNYENCDRLGEALVDGLSSCGTGVFDSGYLEMDLTQTSYSTIPSMDIELGDSVSDHSREACVRYAQGLKTGIDLFFDASSR